MSQIETFTKKTVKSVGITRRADGSVRWIVVNTDNDGDVMRLFFNQEEELVEDFTQAYSAEELNTLINDIPNFEESKEAQDKSARSYYHRFLEEAKSLDLSDMKASSIIGTLS